MELPRSAAHRHELAVQIVIDVRAGAGPRTAKYGCERDAVDRPIFGGLGSGQLEAGCKQVELTDKVKADSPRNDRARPPNQTWHADASFPRRAFSFTQQA